ncbi:MAG: DUF433 domain-containing protein [Candidatus Levybacteria bacterium]|nr:DUF433 domain-containing protein [Candidatus Levybacteria bacterium]
MKKYIVSNPEIMSGKPCITGTRIPVSLMLIRLKQGYTLKKIQEIYHWVPLTTFEGAMEELARQVSDISYEPQPFQA